MLALSSCPAPARDNAIAIRPTLRPTQVRRLARGETLFHAGEERVQLFRVERGALCHYQRQDNGEHEIIEFAFPGDIIGFGHLSEHTSTAQAVAKTIVSPVSEDEFEHLLDTDGQLSARYAAAGDREFEFLRVRAVTSGRGRPAKRVASFLAAIARMGASEGRDPGLITDEFSSGAVAEHLGVSLADLTNILRDLEVRGIASPAREGLRISDIEALERFADAD